jgi:hypothetical protein
VQDEHGQTLQGGDRSYRFHRLFGDVDGNKVVNALDAARFQNSYGRFASDPLFNEAFDYDGNGVIDALDLTQFNKRTGRVYRY